MSEHQNPPVPDDDDGNFDAYSESPYVCANDEDGKPIPWKLVGFDTNKVKLVGEDA